MTEDGGIPRRAPGLGCLSQDGRIGLADAMITGCLV